MKKWARFLFQPVLPIGENGTRVTGGKEHIALSRKAAAEGMVLLKNDQKILPFEAGTKVALFGKGCVDYVKGGGGSGDVTVAYTCNLVDGMRNKVKSGKAEIYEPLAQFYELEIGGQYEKGSSPGLTEEPDIPPVLLDGAKEFTDTAVISICRFSGENSDRKDEDFYLSVKEQKLVELVAANFTKIVVVLNVGGVVSTWFKDDERIQAALMAWQGGMEGGLAIADVLFGEANPSGKLVDTFAKKLEDYPSSYNFHDSAEYVEYTEDIYVGYRYFETVPGAAKKVNYPFGFGLSYTEFEITYHEAGLTDDGIEIVCSVTNIGEHPGREVVQLYVSAPQGKLGKPAKELKAYQKTRLLQPGEMQEMKLTASFYSLSSYDDLGKVQKAAYVLEKGEYKLWLGVNVRDIKELPFIVPVPEDKIITQLSSKCVPNMLKERMLSDGTMESLEMDSKGVRISKWEKKEPNYCPFPEMPALNNESWLLKLEKCQFEEVANGTCTLEEFMKQLSLDDMIQLLCGHMNTGVANTFGMGDLPILGVPNVMTADDPAGVRIRPECGINTTAFPCATLLACTWDLEMIEEIGKAGAEEMIENNLGIWLTPGMNIHRSPLCGRNFEYYSEDPLVTGKTGAAMVRGIQSKKIAACVKHFALNNKETNRFESDSRVSERALREIYLKGFEIAVKEANPWMVMSAYNIVNGQRASEHKELLTGILRDEWGFHGMVTSDWWNHAEQYLEIKAGNDVKMGCGYPESVKAAYVSGKITENEIYVCAKRVLEMILKLA